MQFCLQLVRRHLDRSSVQGITALIWMLLGACTTSGSRQDVIQPEDTPTDHLLAVGTDTAMTRMSILMEPYVEQDSLSNQIFLGLSCESDKKLSTVEWALATQDSMLLPISAGVRVQKQPAILSSPPLSYPTAALQARFEGTVIVQGVVELDGYVQTAAVIDSRVKQHSSQRLRLMRRAREYGESPPNISPSDVRYEFEQAALSSIRQALFMPGTLDGQPLRILVCMQFNFNLNPRNR